MSYPEDSTHVQRWVFTEEALRNNRETLNGSVRSKLMEIEARKPLKGGPLQYLSVEEEIWLIDWYANALLQFFDICASKNESVPYKTQYTAVSYFRRFYAKHSVMEFDPTLIVGGCIFAALKVEGNYTFPLNLVSSFFKDFIHAELPILGMLDFNLMVIHLRTPLRRCGDLYRLYVKSLQQKDTTVEMPVKELGETVNKSEKISIYVAASDCGILFAPSQLSFGLFLSLGEQNNLPYLEGFVRDYIVGKFQKTIQQDVSEGVGAVDNTVRRCNLNMPTEDKIWATVRKVEAWIPKLETVFTAPTSERAAVIKELFSRAKRCFKLITPFSFDSTTNPSSMTAASSSGGPNKETTTVNKKEEEGNALKRPREGEEEMNGNEFDELRKRARFDNIHPINTEMAPPKPPAPGADTRAVELRADDQAIYLLD